MKKILPGEKRATSPNISVNGSVTSDKRCIANPFNKFFASVATRLTLFRLGFFGQSVTGGGGAPRTPPSVSLESIMLGS